MLSVVGVWEIGRKLDDRIVRWDQRFSRRLGAILGIKSDSELPPAERVDRALRRGRFTERPPIVAEVSDFMNDGDAEALLRESPRLPPSARLLCMRGILQEAWLSTGERGVTRSSVEAEIGWRRTASRRRKFRRAVGGFVRWF